MSYSVEVICRPMEATERTDSESECGFQSNEVTAVIEIQTTLNAQ